MEKKFFQSLANYHMFRKLTTTFPILKKEKLEDKDIEDAIHELRRDGIYQAIKESRQNPHDFAEIALNAFDDSVKIARIRLDVALKRIAAQINK